MRNDVSFIFGFRNFNSDAAVGRSMQGLGFGPVFIIYRQAG